MNVIDHNPLSVASVFRMGLLALGLVFGGCRNSKIASDTLVIGIESEIKNLDVRYAADANTGQIATLLTQSLVQMGDDFLAEPDLAESFEDIGSKTFKFKLPSGLKFHDGTPLTAKDVLYSFQQASGPKSRIKSSFVDVASFEAPDPLSFVITLKKPNTAFLLSELAVIRIFPAHLGESEEYGKHPVGSGPYRFVQRRDRDLYFERFDDYSSYRSRKGLEPRPMKKLVVRAIEDPTTRFLSLVGGDIDALFNALSPRKLIEVATLPKQLTIYRDEGTSYQYIGLNQKIEKFRDPRIRRALALAINRPDIIRHKLNGFAQLASGLIPPRNPYATSELPQLAYNPAEARELLKAAHAENLTVELKCSTDRDVVSILQVVQKNWQDVGINVNLKPAEFSTFFAEVREGNFEVFSLRWTNVTEPDLLFKIYHSREFPPGRNRVRYSNPKLDNLLEAARSESDFGRRRAIYSDAQKIISADLPYISLWYPDNVAVLSANVRGFKLSPSGSWRGIYAAHKVESP